VENSDYPYHVLDPTTPWYEWLCYSYWFHKKWGLKPEVPMDEVYERLAALEDKVSKLEEENVELTNEIYRLENSLDARIDILAEHCRINYDV
jgi:cell division protein FtsB